MNQKHKAFCNKLQEITSYAYQMHNSINDLKDMKEEVLKSIENMDVDEDFLEVVDELGFKLSEFSTFAFHLDVKSSNYEEALVDKLGYRINLSGEWESLNSAEVLI